MYTVAHPRFPRRGAPTLGLGQKNIITARKRSLGQGNIFAPVCHSVHRGSASVHAVIPPPPPPTRHTPWTRHTPPDQASSRPGTPPDQAPPPGPGTPGPGTPQTRHSPTPPPGQACTPLTRHPPRCRACLEIRSTRGRYASYWNAILFGKNFAENCMKMKEIGPRGEQCVPSAPIRYTNDKNFETLFCGQKIDCTMDSAVGNNPILIS